VPYLFGTTDLPGTAKFIGSGEEAQRLSRAVMRNWAHFARYGRPSDEWPEFGAENPVALHFDRDVHARPLADDATHRLWDALLAG
jgi:carboxylesterase type B